MNIILGNSYWHKRYNLKVWVRSTIEDGVYETEDVTGYGFLAFEKDLEEVE